MSLTRIVFINTSIVFVGGCMHRSHLKNQLLSYNPVDKKELASKIDMLQFIETYPNCFERFLEVGHITASSWLLNKDHDKVLLMHHAKLDLWCQLGGHCDGDSNTLAVALKEAQEESGIQGIEPVSCDIFDIDIHLIPENPREKAHYHYDVRYLLHVVSDEQIIQNKESKELRWVGTSRLHLPTNSESVVRMFDKWVHMT